MNTYPGRFTFTLALATVLAGVPGRVSAQPLDSLAAHRLAMAMAEDLGNLESLSDARFVRHGLPAIEAYFGIEFELPASPEPERQSIRAHLDVVYATRGAEAALDEAARLDRGPSPGAWTSSAVSAIARREGARGVLEIVRERGLLDTAFDGVLTGVGLRGLDDVLVWLDDAELQPDLGTRLRARALGFGSVYEPYRFWRRADSLPDPFRTQVRVRALASSAGRDTVPDPILEAELPRVAEVARSFDEGEARQAMAAVSATCARRDLAVCDGMGLPAEGENPWTSSDIVNLTGRRMFGQASRRLEEFRRAHPPLVVARVMAQALEAIDRNCTMEDCDLVRIDSVATEWSTEIRRAEADAAAGRIARTATWNGSDDLTELRRSLGVHLSVRDLGATEVILESLDDPTAVGSILQNLIQSTPGVDLIGAVEIFLEHAPSGLDPVTIHYADLMRAGRPDLAGGMLQRASGPVATHALVDWGWALTSAARVDEARTVFRKLMDDGDYQYPVGDHRLLVALERLRMTNEYVRHVRALPTPLDRLNGTFPLLSAWVRRAPAN